MNHSKITPAAPRMPQGSIGDKLRGAFGVGKTRWGMLALVFFATTLNYIDRAALGIMQPVLAKEMSWTAMDTPTSTSGFRSATRSASCCRAG